MKRIGILTAGGDTPALNATIHGAVMEACRRRIEVVGVIKGYGGLFNPRVPHAELNPLFQPIPELDPTRGGTLLGASRDYIPADDVTLHDVILRRLQALRIEGLICVGGDGTLNGLQPIAERIPTVLAPKTIDNDLGLNYPNEPDEWARDPAEDGKGYTYHRIDRSRILFQIENMVNYVTPGYATAVFVSAAGVERIRTTAESHRRIAIVEVMGRHSGYIALGSAYGQPDFILVPEIPLDVDLLVDQVKHRYELQKNVVIVCGEGIVGADGHELGAERHTTDPAGNMVLSGAAEALRRILIDRIGDEFFRSTRRAESAASAIFTRKVGHTQRGGRPIAFDRYHAALLGGEAVTLLLEGRTNWVSLLQWNEAQGFYVAGYDGNRLRDRWGHIHARNMHPDFYDREHMRVSRMGTEYLHNIFRSALSSDDMEHVRHTLFEIGNLTRMYHSINTDMAKRIKFFPNAID